MKYTTKENLKEYLWIDVADYDDILDKMITRTTQQFDKYLWRNLEETTYTEYAILDEENIIIVDKSPINTILNLKEKNSSWDDIEYERIDWQIVFLLTEYTWAIYLEYKAWYTSLDNIQDVEQACLEVCKDLWNNTPTSGNEANIKSKKIETLSKTYFSKDEMAWWISINFRETLDNYITINPLAI